jgi:hypothetical protein
MQRAFRHRIKQALHEVEIDFDPDRDWEEANLSHKKNGEEYGTKFGFHVPPHPDDSIWDLDWYEEMIRCYDDRSVQVETNTGRLVGAEEE